MPEPPVCPKCGQRLDMDAVCELTEKLAITCCVAAATGQQRDMKFSDSYLQESIDSIRELYDSNEQHEQSFDLRWKADMRAIKKWQEATGRTMIWPDHTDLCTWLMEQNDTLRLRVAELEKRS